MPRQYGSTMLLGAVLAAVALLSGCDGQSPTTPSVCSYELTPTSASFGSSGGTGQLTVATQPDCGWRALSKVPWIAITGGATGVDSGTVTFSVSPNTGPARQGALTIGDQAFSVTQEGLACSFDVSPQSSTFPAEGGTGTLQVTTASACAWTAEAAASWIVITSGTTGQGNGVVSFSVTRQTDPAGRTATIRVAGLSIAIQQSGATAPPPPVECDYSVAPTEVGLHWHETGAQVALTTTAGCTWTVDSGAEWLTLSTPSAGAGPATIRFGASIFTDPGSRRAPIRVRWPTATAGQNVWVTQEGCYYAISVKTQAAPAAGGTSTVFVLGTPVSVNCMVGCPWTAVSEASWIQIVSSMPRAGDDLVTYRIEPNTTGQSRTGTIRIETAVLTVIQAAN
jgi:hypothetical protein